jgi:hypothetical protein
LRENFLGSAYMFCSRRDEPIGTTRHAIVLNNCGLWHVSCVCVCACVCVCVWARVSMFWDRCASITRKGYGQILKILDVYIPTRIINTHVEKDLSKPRRLHCFKIHSRLCDLFVFASLSNHTQFTPPVLQVIRTDNFVYAADRLLSETISRQPVASQ